MIARLLRGLFIVPLPEPFMSLDWIFDPDDDDDENGSQGFNEPTSWEPGDEEDEDDEDGE